MNDQITHLYVIGNGFDLFTGFKTSYSDFKHWLKRKYVFVYEAMNSIYGATGELWCDFENQLGKLNIEMYASKYPPPSKTQEEIQEEIRNIKEHEKDGDGLPHFYHDSPCAHRLEGLLDILQYCFEKWVQDEQRWYRERHYTRIIKEGSMFINFNYTDTLEYEYKIPDARVLHIHGRAKNHEHLVFGHNTPVLWGDIKSDDEQRVAEILARYEKNPYYYILHYDLQEKIKDIEHIHVLGLSFSDVDIPYMEWIAWHTRRNCDWEVSWHSEDDKVRINNFLYVAPCLRGQIKLFQIEETDEP